MKVSVRLTCDGLTRADALVDDIRRRALARLEARIAAREATGASSRGPRVVEVPVSVSTPPGR